jgi:Ca-activated chloride channel family protein
MLESFHFLRPVWLSLFIPFVILIAYRLVRQTGNVTQFNHLPSHLQEALIVGEQGWSRHAPIILLSFIGVLAIFVAAGPSWEREPSPVAQDIAPLVIVLDASNSMLESDLPPSRLHRAKQKIKQLVEQREGGVFALIAYSGSAHQVMPLTKDKSILAPMLDAVSPQVMPYQGKFEHYTLPIIRSSLERSIVSGTVLLLTDAVNRDYIADWQSYTESTGENLIVWGIGNSGIDSIQPFDESTLKLLASSTKGTYVGFTDDGDDIKQINKEINQHLSDEGDQHSPWKDASYPLIWLIVPCYLLWARRGWLVQWCVTILVISSSIYTPNSYAADWAIIDLWASRDQQAQYQIDQGNFKQAAKLFEDYQWKAYAYYQAGDYKQAEIYYRRVDNLDSMQGVGASLMHQKEYVAARDWYKAALTRYPESQVIEQNLALAESILAYISQFTEGQSKSSELQNSRELGDKPQTSEGVEKQVQREQVIQKQLTADEILNNPELNQQWMKRVNGRHELFLANKFYAQLEQGEGTQSQSESYGDKTTNVTTGAAK